MRVVYNDREVRSPFLRALVGALAICGVLFGTILTMVVLVVVIPLSLPWHVLLRAFGRRGFYEPGSMSYHVPMWGVLLSIAPVLLLWVASWAA